MPDADRARILALLESGRITADQAAVLLDAVGPSRGQGTATPGAPGAPSEGAARPRGDAAAAGGTPAAASAGSPSPRPPAQLIRITIDAREGDEDKAHVHVNVPLKLARFAARFVPKEARSELDAQGIDLAELLAGLGDEVPDGPLVDIDAKDDGGGRTARIRVEVV
ncbi:MAG: hypothetical protein U5K81_00195 [Trueperaceae bacterium]|nr:hypothetical protein [Trueperaceae bacterium]